MKIAQLQSLAACTCERHGRFIKISSFLAKIVYFFDQIYWEMSSGCPRRGGLCSARMGHFGHALGTSQEGAWEKRASCGSWVGKGGGNWWALLITRACRWLDHISPDVVPAGFALARGRHSTCSPPAPGAQVAGKGDIKRTSGKAPVWHTEGREPSMNFPQIRN